MLIKDGDALARINSPMNLLNRLRRPERTSMHLFGMGDTTNKNENLIKTAVPTFVNPFQQVEQTEQAPAQSKIQYNPQEAQSETAVSVNDLLDGADTRIRLAHAHDLALNTVVEAIQHMRTKLDDVKPDKLPAVITAASKVVDGIRRERNEAAKVSANRAVHLHFYTPTPKRIEEYDVIDVG